MRFLSTLICLTAGVTANVYTSPSLEARDGESVVAGLDNLNTQLGVSSQTVQALSATDQGTFDAWEATLLALLISVDKGLQAIASSDEFTSAETEGFVNTMNELVHGAEALLAGLVDKVNEVQLYSECGKFHNSYGIVRQAGHELVEAILVKVPEDLQEATAEVAAHFFDSLAFAEALFGEDSCVDTPPATTTSSSSSTAYATDIATSTEEPDWCSGEPETSTTESEASTTAPATETSTDSQATETSTDSQATETSRDSEPTETSTDNQATETSTDSQVTETSTESQATETATDGQVTETSTDSQATETSTTDYTTSTIYTTTVETVTACPQTVTNCPLGHVITKTIAISTTICPVTETKTPDHPPKLTNKPGHPAGVHTTSTIYTTTVYTVTKCPATVPDCPVGHVTTESHAVGTTVYPVTDTPTKPIKPTGGSGEDAPIKPTGQGPPAGITTPVTAGITSPAASAGILTTTKTANGTVITKTPVPVVTAGAAGMTALAGSFGAVALAVMAALV